MSTVPGPRVLVVDDDEDVRSSLGRALRLSGFVVATADDGSSALRQVAADPPDCVVLDVTMPRMDGVAVVTALRALCPCACSAPAPPWATG